MQANSPESSRGKKYPYKARTVADRSRIAAECSTILVGIDAMIWKIARGFLEQLTDESGIEDVVQRCRIHLWQKSLPKYNAWEGVKVTTFLHTCITNYMMQERRAVARVRRRDREANKSLCSYPGLVAPDRSLDAKIAAISIDIYENPLKYMTPAQANVFRAVVNNPDTMMKVLAVNLDYARASSLSMIKRRIKERIAEVDIESFEGHG